MTIASTHAWYNGELTALEAGAPSIASITFHLGTGVFDGLMAYWNNDRYLLHCAEDHLVRFRRGANRMGLTFRWTVEQLRDGIEALLAVEPKGTQYVRPIVYRRAPELWVTGSEGRPVDVSIFTVRVDATSSSLLDCHVSPVERISCRSIPGQTKVCGAYVNSFNARRTAEQAGYHDGIMLDRHGRITEASAANVFFVAGDSLLTPQLNEDVFPGITRKVVQKLAADLGIRVIESDLYPQQLQEIDGAFLCSTLMEIRGIAKLDKRILATAENPVYRSIVDAFAVLTRH
jgi:branched-chain amino acid aminotransferase